MYPHVPAGAIDVNFSLLDRSLHIWASKYLPTYSTGTLHRVGCLATHVRYTQTRHHDVPTTCRCHLGQECTSSNDEQTRTGRHQHRYAESNVFGLRRAHCHSIMQAENIRAARLLLLSILCFLCRNACHVLQRERPALSSRACSERRGAVVSRTPCVQSSFHTQTKRHADCLKFVMQEWSIDG